MGLFDHDARVTAILDNLEVAVGDLRTISQALANAQARQSGSALGLARPSLGGFRFPITLPTFLDVIAQTEEQNLASYVLVRKVSLVPGAANGVPGAASFVYAVPSDATATIASNSTVSSSAYSPDLRLTVIMGEGQAGSMVAAFNAPLTEAMVVPQAAAGAVAISGGSNMTLNLVNFGSADVTVTFSGYLFLAEQALYEDLIAPFFDEQYRGLLEAIAL